MNENTSTKPEVINARLSIKNDVDILTFELISESTPFGIDVNLNSESGQVDLKKVFSALLEKMLHAPIELNFVVTEGYTTNLFIDVCKEYISALNLELAQVYSNMQYELKL